MSHLWPPDCVAARLAAVHRRLQGITALKMLPQVPNRSRPHLEAESRDVRFKKRYDQ